MSLFGFSGNLGDSVWYGVFGFIAEGLFFKNMFKIPTKLVSLALGFEVIAVF